MKVCDEKLSYSLMEAMRLDNARLEEELKYCEPHVFSEEFKTRVENLVRVQRQKRNFQT